MKEGVLWRGCREGFPCQWTSGRYASYWNAFLFMLFMKLFVFLCLEPSSLLTFLSSILVLSSLVLLIVYQRYRLFPRQRMYQMTSHQYVLISKNSKARISLIDKKLTPSLAVIFWLFMFAVSKKWCILRMIDFNLFNALFSDAIKSNSITVNDVWGWRKTWFVFLIVLKILVLVLTVKFTLVTLFCNMF